jgi:2-polyprenyl-6-methoxyphenol hydroxylase-like FAD-dependent oxidoreductase
MGDQQALIVGAGPTGLSMAIEFKRLGVPFRLVEKSSRPAQYSQALVVQARTLEQFERYGIAETAVQRGKPLKHASVISEGRTIVSFPFDKVSAAKRDGNAIDRASGIAGRANRARNRDAIDQGEGQRG